MGDDVRRKAKEPFWTERVDRFVTKFTPEWFNWLGWTLALGALQYLFVRTKSPLLALIIGVSYILFWLYLVAYFDKTRPINIPFVKSHQVKILISTFAMVALGTLFYAIYHLIANLIGLKGGAG